MENKFAVITGASSGIGFELARQFGQNSFELLIVSSSDDIFTAQRELEGMGYVVEALKTNLSTYAGVENLYQRILRYGKVLNAVAINAGVGAGGAFTDTGLKEEINIINQNIVSAVHLVKRILPEMKERGKGKILFTFSIASQMPSPYEAVYGASMAFLTSFAESIRNEMKASGVTITVLRAGMVDSEIARHGYEALMAGKESISPENFLTKIQSYAVKLQRKLSEPGSAHH